MISSMHTYGNDCILMKKQVFLSFIVFNHPSSGSSVAAAAARISISSAQLAKDNESYYYD